MADSIWDIKHDKVQDEFAPGPNTRTFSVNGPGQTQPFFKETTPPRALPTSAPAPPQMARSHAPSALGPASTQLVEAARTPVRVGPDIPLEAMTALPPAPPAPQAAALPVNTGAGPLLTNRGGRPEIIPGTDKSWSPGTGAIPTRAQQGISEADMQARAGAGYVPPGGTTAALPAYGGDRGGLGVAPPDLRAEMRQALQGGGGVQQSILDRILNGFTPGGGISSGNDGSRNSTWNREMEVRQAADNIYGRNGLVSRSKADIARQGLQDSAAMERQQAGSAANLVQALATKALELESQGRSEEAAMTRQMALEQYRQGQETGRSESRLASEERRAAGSAGSREAIAAGNVEQRRESERNRAAISSERMLQKAEEDLRQAIKDYRESNDAMNGVPFGESEDGKAALARVSEWKTRYERAHGISNLATGGPDETGGAGESDGLKYLKLYGGK